MVYVHVVDNLKENMTDNNISFTQIKNWMPLITSALIVAGAFYSLKVAVAVQTEKINQMAEGQRVFLQKYDNSEIKLNNHETRITVLESKKQSSVIQPTQIVKAEPIQSTQPVQQNITINEEKSKKPENKAKENIQQKEEEPDPSPISNLVTPILNILGVN